MIEHDWEKIGSIVSKHSKNLIGFAFCADNPKTLGASAFRMVWLGDCEAAGDVWMTYLHLADLLVCVLYVGNMHKLKDR